jgi:hypothetical protein
MRSATSRAIVHLKIRGAVEYVDAGDEVTETADSESQCAAYLDFCRHRGVDPPVR